MRQAAALLATTAFVAAIAHAEGFGPSLTLLVDFEGKPASVTIQEMRKEVITLFEPVGLKVDVQLRSEVDPRASYEELVYFKMKGSCTVPVDPMLIDERGPAPMAFAHTVGKNVQPFGVVACDRVRSAVNSALWGGQRANKDELMGRALGRVLAHELVHMIGKTSVHGKSGIFKESLSGAQLISDNLSIDHHDAEKLREAWQKSLTQP